MSDGYDSEEFEEFLEDFEPEEEEGEAVVRRRGFRPPSTAVGARLIPPRFSNVYVTEARLQASMARVSSAINKNSAVIKALSGRMDTLRSETIRQNAAFKKDITGIKNSVLLSALLAVVLRPPTKTISVITPPETAPKDVTVLIDDPNRRLLELLPLAPPLLTGLGPSLSQDSKGTVANMPQDLLRTGVIAVVAVELFKKLNPSSAGG